MRWIVRSFMALVVLAVLSAAALLLIPSEKIARVAADRFHELTGRDLTIGGAVRPTLWPTLGVKMDDVSISNAPWSDAGPMFRADTMEVRLDLASLINGAVRVTSIQVMAPQITLERARDGSENWVFDRAPSATGTGGGAEPSGTSGTPLSLDLAEITNGRLTFVDHRSGTDLRLSNITGQARIPDFNGPAQIQMTFQMNGQDADLSAKLASFSGFLAGQVTGSDVLLNAGPAKISFSGKAGLSPVAAAGAIAADLGDLAALSRLAGLPRPDMPAGLGARSASVTGDVTLTEKGSVHLRGGAVVLDGNRLDVDADVETGGDRPFLSAQIIASDLNLAAASGGQGGGAQGGVSAEGWPREVIDVSALSQMDAKVALTATSVDLGAMKFGKTRVLATIDRSRAVFDLKQVAAYDGTIAGQFVVNGRGGLSVGGDLTLSSLALQPMLRDLGGYDRLIGTADLSLRFLGIGNTMEAIMNSLSGEGRFAIGRGELLGLDIAGMLRNLDPNYVGSGQKTIFDSVTAGFTIDKGVLRNDDLTLVAPYVTATGDGRIGLGARTLDYRLRPTALANADGSGGVMVPLLVSGTWAKPKFRLDLESIARERLEEKAKAAEAKAKAELERKAQEELGIERQNGESLEDAAKRRAREALEAEAERALRKLLGQP